jgi:hypothetical protein
MKNKLIQRLLYIVFTVVNTGLLYLFLLQLPFGIDTFAFSVLHWSEMHPRIEIAAAVSLGVALITLLLVIRLDNEWKSRLIYLRRRFAHPGHRAFLGGKDPGFDRRPLKSTYPEVSDSAYDPQVQMQVWQRLYEKHAKTSLVQGTYLSWVLLRDLYLISLIFLVAFLVTWPLNLGVPAVLALSYIFIYGAQLLFLMFSARGTGSRLECNVLAQELGIKPGSIDKVKSKRKKAR